MKAELNSLLSYKYVLTNKLVTSLNIRESVLLLFNNVRIKKKKPNHTQLPLAYGLFKSRFIELSNEVSRNID